MSLLVLVVALVAVMFCYHLYRDKQLHDDHVKRVNRIFIEAGARL